MGTPDCCSGTAKRRIKEAVIKSAASAASLGFAGDRQDDGPACGRRGTGRSPANPREAALAAVLIKASLIRLLAVPGRYLSGHPAAALGGQDQSTLRLSRISCTN